MSISGWLLMLVIVSYAVARETLYASRNDGLRRDERSKRALPAVFGKVLGKATNMVKRKNFGLYEKSGGYTAALADFRLMNPSNIRSIGSTRFGTVGDHHVTLYKLRDKTWLNIWTNKQEPEGVETWSRIYYTQ